MDSSTNSHTPDCPYVGLQPYTEAEREYFFGREQDTETIAANLLTAPLTLLYGASGVGKTSVLAAGVVPYLRAMPDVIVVQFRAWQDETFQVLLMDAVAREIHSTTGKSFHPGVPLLPDEFIVRAAQENKRTFLIIFDQFEEYFLYHPNVNPFDEQFARVVNRNDANVNFLLSLREDVLSQLDRFETRIPNLMSNYLRLEHLNREGAARAIRKPLDVYNAKHAGAPPVTIEDALVDTLIDQIRTGRVILGQRAGRGEVSTTPPVDIRIETPFLQMVLTRLWDEETRTGSYNLKLSALERLGGAEQIVHTYLNNVMSNFTDPEREICWLIFDRLVTPSGTKIAQREDDLVNYVARPAEGVMPVLNKLAHARILRQIAPLDRSHTLRYEIFHDALAPAILDWRVSEYSQTRLDFIPIFSRISAGDPHVIPEHVTEYIQADRILIGGKSYHFANSNVPIFRLTFSLDKAYIAFRVAGDSMNNAGIDDGDYVILRTSSVTGSEPVPEIGDIVAVVFPDDNVVTLKRYRREGTQVVFEPDSKNPNHKSFRFEKTSPGFSGKIVGILVATLKSL